MVVEGALEGELDDHLGCAKNDPAGRNGGTSRNGRRAKTVLTDTGPVEISVPRGRESRPRPTTRAMLANTRKTPRSLRCAPIRSPRDASARLPR